MKILLINNNTVHLKSLKKSLVGHRLEIQKYRSGLDFHWQDKDLVILSGGGGEGFEIHDRHKNGDLWYKDELEFIRHYNKRILGICMGFELIARAHGALITEVGQLIQGYTDLQITKEVVPDLGLKNIRQFESHRWRVEDIPSEFETLATSKTGIEMFRHKNKLATQFHPEKGGSLSLAGLIKAI